MKTQGISVGILCGVGAVILAVALPAVADYAKGVEAYKARDYATAVQEFQKVVEQSPEHAGTQYMLGISLRGAGQVSKSLGSLRKAVDLDPANASYAIALGQTLVQAGEYQEAYMTLKKIRYDSLDARARSSFAPVFATAAIKAGLPGEAIPVLEAQTKASPRDSQLYYSLGYAYSAEGNADKAFSSFKKAYEIDPKDEKSATSAVKAAISAGRRASGSQKSSYYTQGAAIAEKMATSNGNFENLLLAGEAWLGAKDYRKAAVWFDKATAKQSQNTLVRFYRAQCNTSLANYEAAISDLQEALKIGVSGKLREQVYNQMGFIYDKQKEYDKALTAYRNAGNNSMVASIEDKKEKAEQNRAADEAARDYELKLRAIEEQIKELEAIGEMEEARELREHLEKLRNQG